MTLSGVEENLAGQEVPESAESSSVGTGLKKEAAHNHLRGQKIAAIHQIQIIESVPQGIKLLQHGQHRILRFPLYSSVWS